MAHLTSALNRSAHVECTHGIDAKPPIIEQGFKLTVSCLAVQVNVLDQRIADLAQRLAFVSKASQSRPHTSDKDVDPKNLRETEPEPSEVRRVLEHVTTHLSEISDRVDELNSRLDY